LDRRAYAELTTSTVPTPEAFAYWREMICATFVRLAAEPVTTDRFSGRIEHVPIGDLESLHARDLRYSRLGRAAQHDDSDSLRTQTRNRAGHEETARQIDLA
jgi:hypothetical protein